MANLSGLLNGAAALLAISRFNLEQTVLEPALRSFVPGSHRLQKVAEIDGVVDIDDSKATNTGAVINGINQVGGRVILIAGGRDKGDDYRLLRNAVAAHVKHLILIGEAADKLGQALADLAPIDYPASMAEAVVRAAAAAKPGDTVLLSPACASFDMFENYQQRGVSFSNEVQHIAERLSAGVH
jgi:UDP-N-acetylmuramoylalanine--D-glutamate ligase